jgi:hypothetical protein
VSASFIPPYLTGNEVDGPAAVSVIIDSPAYVNAGAKLLSIRNGTVEKAYIDKDGHYSTFQLNILDAAFGSPGASFVVAISGVDANNATEGNVVYLVTPTVDCFCAVGGAAAVNGTSCFLVANTPRFFTFAAGASTVHFITTGAVGSVYCTKMVPVPLP